MYSKDVYEQVLNLKRNGLSVSQIIDITKLPKSTIHDWINKPIKFFEEEIYNPTLYLTRKNSENARNLIVKFYSWTLGFYYGKGNLYKNKRTFEMSFYLNNEKIKKWDERIKLVFPQITNIDIESSNKKSYSYYGKYLPLYYPINKEFQIWQTQLIDITYFFSGLLNCFDVVDNIYVFKSNNEKIHNVFKGCCIQLGIKFEQSQCDTITEIVSNYSIKKIMNMIVL